MPDIKIKIPNPSVILAVLISLSCALFVFYTIAVEVTESTSTYDTDEADHANPGLELYLALSNKDLSATYSALARQSFYPPLHSVFVAAGHFIFGEPFLASSRLPSLVSFVLYTFLLIYCIRIFLLRNYAETGSNSFATAAAFLTGLAAASSPITISNSALCMLEVPGVFLTVVCIYAFVNFDNPSFKNFRIIFVALSGLSVFWMKYSFGIVTVPAVLMTVFLTSKPWRDFDEAFRNTAVCSAFIGIPIIIWLMQIDRDSFYHFFVGHRSYVPFWSKENFLFYFIAWMDSYGINKIVSISSLLLAVFGAIKFYKTPAALFCIFNTAIALLVFTVSTTNEERHIMVAIPSIFFLCGLGLYSTFQKFNAAIVMPLAILSTFAIALNTYQKIPEIKANLQIEFEGEPEFYQLFEFIFSLADPMKPVLFYGISDDFSIEALRWFVAKKTSRAYPQVEVDAYPFRDDKNFTAGKRKRNLDRPYKERGFPKKPLEEVIKRNYYHYAVHVHNYKRKQRFQKESQEMLELLQDRLKGEMQAGSRLVRVYSLIENN